MSDSILSKMALEKLTSFENWVSTFQRLPAIDCTSLDADHVLVSVLGREVANGLRALLPRIPDDSVLKIVPDHIKGWLAIHKDGGSILLQGLVHAVGLSLEFELVTRSGEFRLVEELVIVLRACETSNGDLGNVLIQSSALTFPTRNV